MPFAEDPATSHGIGRPACDDGLSHAKEPAVVGRDRLRSAQREGCRTRLRGAAHYADRAGPFSGSCARASRDARGAMPDQLSHLTKPRLTYIQAPGSDERKTNA